MNQKKIQLTSLIIFVIVFSSLQSVQGNKVSWDEGDKYTWEMYSGVGTYFENETTTWDNHYFFLNHRIDVKILDIKTIEKIIGLKVTLYYSPSADKPFTAQEVENSYDFIDELFEKDITSLFYFNYEFDDTENETYLSSVAGASGVDRIPLMYFCSANWVVTNNLFQVLFSDSAILDTINGIEITFRDFLDNCSYTIMGESDYSDGLNQMVPTNHQWSAKFNYGDLLKLRGPDITSFEVEEANATFDLQYSDGGVLEKFLVRNKYAIYINNNYTFHKYDIREFTLKESSPISKLLLKIIPSAIAGVFIIVIVILVVKIRKKR